MAMIDIRGKIIQYEGYGAIVSALVIFLIFSLIDFSGWWSAGTLGQIIPFAAVLGCIAMGQAFVIITREIDLSVGSVYGLTGIAFIMLESDFGVVGAAVAALGMAATIGILQALAVIKGKVPSMIVTLGGLFAVRGLIYIWTGGTIRSLPEEARQHWFTRLFGGDVFGIEASVYWTGVMFVVLYLLLWKTRFGNRLLAIGGDEVTALSQGISISAIKIGAFVLSSIMAGFAAILTLTDQPQTHVSLGEFMELEAIAAAVIGGCALTGGRGSLLGPLIGAFIITSVRYELIRLGAPASWYISVVGVVLISAVAFNQSFVDWAKKTAKG